MSDIKTSPRLTEYFEILDKYRQSDERQELLVRELVDQEFDLLDEEIQRLIRTKLPSKVGLAEEAIEDLLVYFKLDINSYLDLFFEITKEYVPITIFRGANDENKLRLKTRYDKNCYMALSALAFCSDDFASAQFVHWRNTQPDWWEDNLQIEHFTHKAGWELDEQNQIRYLYRKDCHSIKVSLDHNAKTGRRCEKCQRDLLNLEVEDSGKWFFLDFCDLCVGRECLDETPKWIKKAISIGGLLKFEAETKPRDIYFGIDQLSRHSYSQRGGLPCWIQYPEYPICQACAKTMIFVLQMDGLKIEHSVDWHFDTMFYLFRCEDCPEQFRVTQQFS